MQPPAQEGSATVSGFQGQSKCCDIMFPLQCPNMTTTAAPLQRQHCWESRDEEGMQPVSPTIGRQSLLLPKGSCKQPSGKTCFLPTLLKDHSPSC